MAKTMLYNGVELPGIESVWTGDVKKTHPYAAIVKNMTSVLPVTWRYTLVVSESPLWRDDWISTEDGSYKSAGYVLPYPSMYSNGGIVDGELENWGEFTAYTQQRAINDPIWSNHDIYAHVDAEDGDYIGEIVFAATAPVDPNAPTFTPADFLRWFSLGQAVRRGVKKEATMYSYNGVVLPEINSVWTDKETYPYAVMKRNVLSDGSIKYNLRLLDIKPIHIGNDVVCCYWPSGMFLYGTWDLYPDVNGWSGLNGIEVGGPLTSQLTNGKEEKLLWANTDILSDDGTIYLSASEPIPINE